MSEWVGQLVEKLLPVIAHAVHERVNDRVGERASIRDPSVVREIIVKGAGITALGGPLFLETLSEDGRMLGIELRDGEREPVVVEDLARRIRPYR